MSSRIEQIIEEIEEYIDRDCKFQPLSTTKIIVNKEHLDELLRELRMKTPDEIKRYQKIIANRDAILADAKAKADAMIEEAQVQTTELVSEHEIMQQAYAQANEIVTAATAQAQQILDNATNDANQIRIGAIHYTDDLLSQAEHDEMASAILVTTNMELAEKVSAEVDGFVAVLSRKEIIQKSLDNYGYILVADSLDDAIETVNMIASEHLEIVTKNPFEAMMKVRNAGAIFLGEYSSEPLGDYFAGPNHILPTNGTARFFSPVSVDDFVKKSSIVYYSREALREIHKDIEQFASSEQLTAHANSIAVRFEDEEQ